MQVACSCILTSPFLHQLPTGGQYERAIKPLEEASEEM
jgi:hypothetical protein